MYGAGGASPERLTRQALLTRFTPHVIIRNTYVIIVHLDNDEFQFLPAQSSEAT